MDINHYFTRFITLWDDLKYYRPTVVCTCKCTCGAKEVLEKNGKKNEEEDFFFMCSLAHYIKPKYLATLC